MPASDIEFKVFRQLGIKNHNQGLNRLSCMEEFPQTGQAVFFCGCVSEQEGEKNVNK